MGTQLAVFRGEFWDPSIEDFVKAELPTETIKKFRRVSGPSSARIVASYTGLGNQKREEGGSFDCVGRVTRMGIVADRAAEFYLVDRAGTFDEIYLPAAGQQVLLGAPMEPIYNLKGTVKVIIGSMSAGTYAASFELLKRIPGTFTVR